MIAIGPWELTKPALRSAGGIVASQSVRAAEAGAAILGAGGNAVDAAIATGLALAACEPWMSGLGGCGYMVIQPADGGPASLVEFGVVAPRDIDPARYAIVPGGEADDALFGWPRVVEDRNVIGADSIAVPGYVDGVALAREKFGRLPWAELVAPAVQLAEQGIRLDWFGALSIAAAASLLAHFPASRRQYLAHGFPPLPEGEGRATYLPLGELAKTLKHLAAAGPRDFYEGEIARSMVGELRAAGSRIGLADFAGYRAQLVPALEFDYRGRRIATAADLTAGPTLRRVMGALEHRPLSGKTPQDADYLAYASALRRANDERLARDGAAGDAKGRESCTSHLSVVDRDGMMVALTQTLLSRFGSGILLPSTGIMMNNGMMWFDPRPGRANSIAPGRRPLANMCPVVVRQEGAPWLALGASGGRRILPAVTELLSFTIDYGMDLQTAFHQPRLDESARGIVTIDGRLSESLARLIAKELGPVEKGAADVFPMLFANPSAVIRRDAINTGMGEVTSPWSGAAAEKR